MIDLTKPLELDDGTPVSVVDLRMGYQDGDEAIPVLAIVKVRLPEGKHYRRDEDSELYGSPGRSGWWYHLSTGEFHNAEGKPEYYRIQNVGAGVRAPSKTAKRRRRIEL